MNLSEENSVAKDALRSTNKGVLISWRVESTNTGNILEVGRIKRMDDERLT